MNQTYQEWLETAQVGEAVGILTAISSKKHGNSCATYTLTPAVIEYVCSTHIKAGGQRFRKTNNASGDIGRSTSGDHLIRHADVGRWELKIRMHAAYNALKDASDPDTRRLLAAVEDFPDAEGFPEQLVAVVENVVRMHKSAQKEAGFAARMLREQADKFWKAKRG